MKLLYFPLHYILFKILQYPLISSDLKYTELFIKRLFFTKIIKAQQRMTMSM